MTDINEIWRPYLDPDEVVLWQGRPQRGWSWRAGENATILLGVFIIGFFLFAAYDMNRSGQSGGFGGLLVGTVIGLVIGASGPVAMAVMRRGTWYALTDRRALIAHWPTIAGKTLYRGIDCYPITDVKLLPADLRGLQTVRFSWLSRRYTFKQSWISAGDAARGIQQGTRDANIGFERITEGDHVAQLCEQVLRDRKHQLPDNLL